MLLADISQSAFARMRLQMMRALPLLLTLLLLVLLPLDADGQGQLVTACTAPGKAYSCRNCTGRSASAL